MKSVITLFLCFNVSFLCAQNDTLTFESVSIPTDSFINNSGELGLFEIDPFLFPNNYNAQFNSWSGWSFTNKMDTITPGFNNQYSSANGVGAVNSSNYAVSFGRSNYVVIDRNELERIHGVYINNSTYTYLSMLNGDSFAKKFGGETGEDPDFFLLSISAKSNSITIQDTIKFYLADFRSDSIGDDYILRDWTYIDLETFAEADTLFFQLSSSDVGDFGMNTPAYFCLDNFVYTRNQNVSVNGINRLKLNIYPNPVVDRIIIDKDLNNSVEYAIFELSTGRLIEVGNFTNREIYVDHLSSGSYILEFIHEKSRIVGKFIKH